MSLYGDVLQIMKIFQVLEDEEEFKKKYNSNTYDGIFGRDSDTKELFKEAARQMVKNHKQIIKTMRTSEVQRFFGETVSKRYADKIIDGSASRYTLLLELLKCSKPSPIYIELKNIVEFLLEHRDSDYYAWQKLPTSNVTHVKLH